MYISLADINAETIQSLLRKNKIDKDSIRRDVHILQLNSIRIFLRDFFLPEVE